MNIVTPKEFAEIYKIDRETVYALLRKGKLPAVKFGQQWRIDLDKVNLPNTEGKEDSI